MPKIKPDLDRGRGRGERAVADMKNRLAAMKLSGMSGNEILDALWERNRMAVTGDGFVNDMADA